ncbi:MAG: pilus assembly protein PilP [Thermodesulforhabdaceae bacterium]
MVKEGDKVKKKAIIIYFMVFLTAIIFRSGSVFSQVSADENRALNEENQTTTFSEEGEKKKKEELKNRAFQLLLKPDFTFASIAKVGNPFVPFVQPQQKAPVGQVGEEAPPRPVLLTPLQKMEIGEIEKGFKGILWSAGERRAIIEDPTGKGYIVSVGTPIGTQDGFISAILKDRIIIRQKVWDNVSRAFKDQDVVVKLRKKPEAEEAE